MRALRILLILVVIFGGLFVAADRAAVYFAQGQVADKIRTSQGLSSTPTVSIKGFPFLTQVVGSSLDQVDISMGSLDATAEGQTVKVTDVHAELRDVTIDSSFSSATAGQASGSARVSYADLARTAPKGATIGYAGAERAAKGQVKISGPATDILAGADIPVPDVVAGALQGQDITVYCTAALKGGNTATFQAVEVGDLPIPGLDDQIKGLVDSYDLKIDGLPSSITLDKVTATEEGLRFSGNGTNVALAG
ncbi:DUF2993 domain-containing protein [Streptomyces liangshanensis]|uniref:LmeA family phospholipid-binding protein n=1 Tax=Streptomyces liangshanensis TaxID=2717324 RepID=UPI001AAF533D|nr:DUF2993 domain-containing protein [Streptomyces liangshanensis]